MIHFIYPYSTANNIINHKQTPIEKPSFKGQIGEKLIKKAAIEGKELPTAEMILDEVTALRGLSVSKTRDVLETLLSIIKRHNEEKSELEKINNKLKREIQFLENDGDKLAAEIQRLLNKANIEINRLKAKVTELEHK